MMDQEIAGKFSADMEALIENFKTKLKRVAEDTLNDMYTDVAIHAEYDSFRNFENHVRAELREDLRKEILEQGSVYSFAASIRELLLKNHRNELQTAIVKDLQEKLRLSEQRNSELWKRL